LFSFILTTLLFGCIGRRYLGENQKLLVQQEITDIKGLNKEEIKLLYEYEPNSRVLFFPWSPYVNLYHAGMKRYDSVKYENRKLKIAEKYDQKITKAGQKGKDASKYRARKGKKTDKQNRNIKDGNLAMRLGEPLAVFDTLKEQQTVENIREYLHTKGFFNGSVTYTSDEQFKLVTTTFHVERNKPYTIDSLFYNVPDSTLKSLLISTHIVSHILEGSNYEQENLVKERERINNLMLNNGYYDFNRQYLSFDVDSAYLGNKRIIIGINIQNPTGRNSHKIFTVDSVIFTTDADISGLSGTRQSTDYNNVRYQYYKRRYAERILDWRLFLYSDSLYNRDNTFETQKQLSNMDIFKFVNVNYDTVGGHLIANVFTSPLKRYETAYEVGLNVSKGLPGPFLLASLKNRNTFRGLDVVELSGRIGYEGLSGATETGSPYSSFDYGVKLSFTFPQFMIPISQEFKSRVGHFNPKTRLTFGLNFTDRTEYLRNNINTSLAYSWQNYDKNRTYNFSIADISFIKSDLSQDYLRFLLDLQGQGNNLINSFNNAFVSSSWISVLHNINDYGNRNEKSSYFRYYAELGGNLAKLVGEVSFIEDSIEFYQFAKFQVDYRHSRPLNTRITLAYRLNIGVAIPYGDNQTLPYEKFFFAGGSNSIRAWQPRRLGPGSFAPIDTEGNYNNRFEQPAAILFESSIEFRHKLFGFIRGAVFIDAGNVWTLRDDPVRPGAQFKLKNFAKEIAIGAGYGIRLDLSFLLLRLDAAWKIYDPAKTTNSNNPPIDGRNIQDFNSYKRLVWNLGIGFPF